jgi:photosystem I subunit XII
MGEGSKLGDRPFRLDATGKPLAYCFSFVTSCDNLFQNEVIYLTLMNVDTSLYAFESKLYNAHRLKQGVVHMSAISDTQIYVALVIALIPAVLAFRLSTELYK